MKTDRCPCLQFTKPENHVCCEECWRTMPNEIKREREIARTAGGPALKAATQKLIDHIVARRAAFRDDLLKRADANRQAELL